MTQVVLNEDNVNAVMVASPTETHEYYVRKSLSTGLGVFCEKPIAGDIKSVTACYEEAERVQKPLFCAFQRRFDPAMSNVYQSVKEGKLGKLYKVKTCSRDGRFPSISYLKISSGIYHDSAIHDIDMICWIVGEEPVGVMALGSAFHSEVEAIGDFDTIAVNLKFPSGVLGYIDLSRHSTFGYDQRLEVSIHSLRSAALPFCLLYLFCSFFLPTKLFARGGGGEPDLDLLPLIIIL